MIALSARPGAEKDNERQASGARRMSPGLTAVNSSPLREKQFTVGSG